MDLLSMVAGFVPKDSRGLDRKEEKENLICIFGLKKARKEKSLSSMKGSAPQPRDGCLNKPEIWPFCRTPNKKLEMRYTVNTEILS